MLYDSTIIEPVGTDDPGTSPSAKKKLWPYTMDHGIPQVSRAPPLLLLERQHAWAGAPFAPPTLPAHPRAPHVPPPPPPNHRQDCHWTYPDTKCNKDESYPGMWEVPMWDISVRAAGKAPRPETARASAATERVHRLLLAGRQPQSVFDGPPRQRQHAHLLPQGQL